ncbi:unnamed protein product [Urochloa humidicola]
MAKGEGARDGGSALKTAVIVAGGLALAWVTVETAFRPFLDRLRGAVFRNTDPASDPDKEEAPAPATAPAEVVEEKAPAPEEPSAPPAPAAEEKVAELEEKVEEAAAAAADAADKAE